MSRRDIFDDIAAIKHRLPDPPDDTMNEFEHDAASSEYEQTLHEREVEAERLRMLAEHDNADPLLVALGQYRHAKELAERRIRELLAYGREFVQPRPYTLGDLAAAAGMSISGVRTAYDHAEVAAVAAATGAKSREWRATDPADEQEAK